MAEVDRWDRKENSKEEGYNACWQKPMNLSLSAKHFLISFVLYINTPLALFFSNNKPNQESQTKKTRPFSSLILSFVFFFCPTLLGFQVLYSLFFHSW
jgi:predicted permease